MEFMNWSGFAYGPWAGPNLSNGSSASFVGSVCTDSSGPGTARGAASAAGAAAAAAALAAAVAAARAAAEAADGEVLQSRRSRGRREPHRRLPQLQRPQRQRSRGHDDWNASMAQSHRLWSIGSGTALSSTPRVRGRRADGSRMVGLREECSGGASGRQVGVNCDVFRPGRQAPDEGRFRISVECAASVSVEFAGGRGAEDQGQRLSTLLETLCGGEQVLSRRALCVAPGAFAWEVRADVLVLSSGGNLLDSASLALCAALAGTLLPRVEVVEAAEEGEQMQLTVDDRPEVGTPVPLSRWPLCVTVAQ
ncbi:unnamed protein product, partial [Prorocentrum cordatum]